MEVEVGKRYLFNATRKRCPWSTKCSDEFSDKYLYWDMVSGKEIYISKKNPEDSEEITLYVVDYGPTHWVTAVPGFGAARCDWDNFLQPFPQQATKSVCQCNLWISGCKCGAFKKEQQARV